MLVLSRQSDETIMIGDDIEVTVVDIRGDKVRLGINAPKEISVHRKEVYDAIRRENRAAAQVKPEDLSGSRQDQPAKTRSQRPPHKGTRRRSKSVTPKPRRGNRNVDSPVAIRSNCRYRIIAIGNPIEGSPPRAPGSGLAKTGHS